MRIFFLAWLICASAHGYSQSRPHVLWLVAEDLSPILASFGDSTVRTPHIERLAAEGVRYTNVYSTSGVCAPSRATLAAGMYHNSIGAHNMRVLHSDNYLVPLGLQSYEVVPPPEVRMMSEILRANGYYCTNNAKNDYQFIAPQTAWDENGVYAHWGNRQPGQPFFAIYNFEITHESQVFEPHRKQLLRYDLHFPPDRENHPYPHWTEKQDSSQWAWFVPEDLDVPLPPYLPDNEITRRDVRRVYSNIVELDRQIGIVLSALEKDGLLDSTIIVFYTDHGGPLPRQKRLMYDSGLRLPMVIRFPKKERAGEVDDQLISFVDFAPTTFSLAGIEPPAWLQGQAFLGTYRAAEPRRYIHAAADRLDEHTDMIRAVRDERYKYLRNFRPELPYYMPLTYREQMASMRELLRLRDAGELNEVQMRWFRPNKPEEELFDTWADPHELRDLAADPQYGEKLAELRAECERWMKAIDDKGHIPEARLLEQFWPGRTQPQTASPVFDQQGGRLLLSCATEGASIGYKIWLPEDEEPGVWRVYTDPIALRAGAKIKAMAHRIGYLPSEIKTY
jgi:N-sulfoglucosamine sulfohydrolase